MHQPPLHSGADLSIARRIDRSAKIQLSGEAALINDILKDLEYVDEGGALMYKDVRYMLIRPETIIEFQRAAETETGSEKIGQILYRAGHRGGTLSAAHFCEELALANEEIVRFMANMGGQLGWGRMEITSMRPDRGTLELEVFHSLSHDQRRLCRYLGLRH